MEISLREWLIIGGILVIVLILIDGWRRIRGNRNRIKMEIDHTVIADPGESDSPQPNPELPNGGVRRLAEHGQERHEPSFGPLSAEQDEPVQKRSTPVRRNVDQILADLDEPPARKVTAPRAPLSSVDEPLEPRRSEAEEWMPEQEHEPEPEAPREEQAPLRDGPSNELRDMDPLFDDIPVESTPRPRERKPSRNRVSDAPLRAEREAEAEPEPEPTSMSLDFDLEQPIPVLMDRVRQNGGRKNRKAEPAAGQEHPIQEQRVQELPFDLEHEDSDAPLDLPVAAPDKQSLGADSGRAKPKEGGAQSGGRTEQVIEPDEMLVIFVVAPKGHSLPGAGIRRIAEACGMEYGAMEIFHRHEEPNAQGPLQFSMANAVNPGTFELSRMEESETPAVSFFMSMREPSDPLTAYECMLATAETLARHLNGELLDGDRSVMRPQTKEHYRERIRDFEIHNRVKRAH